MRSNIMLRLAETGTSNTHIFVDNQAVSICGIFFDEKKYFAHGTEKFMRIHCANLENNTEVKICGNCVKALYADD